MGYDNSPVDEGIRYQAVEYNRTANNIAGYNQFAWLARAMGFKNTVRRHEVKDIESGLAAQRKIDLLYREDANKRSALGLSPRAYGSSGYQPEAASHDGGPAGSGDGLITRFIKGIYNEEKNGFQFGSIAGGVGGIALGGLMGSFIASSAGELGAGWLGTTAMVLLGGAGMVYGSQLVDSALTPSPLKPGGTQVAAISPDHARVPQVGAPDINAALNQVDADPKNKPTTKATDVKTVDPAEPASKQSASATQTPETKKVTK